MPRKTPVPQREIEIGSRLEEFRKTSKLTRVAFAKECGLDSNLLSSYERGRVPVPYTAVKQIGEKFDINQRWLANGTLPKKSYISVSQAVEKAIPSRALFSFAYDNLLGEMLNEAHAAAAKMLDVEEKDIPPHELDTFQPLGDPDAALRYALLRNLKFIQNTQAILPTYLLKKYVQELDKMWRVFLKKNRLEIEAYMKNKEGDDLNYKRMLTQFSKKTILATKHPTKEL